MRLSVFIYLAFAEPNDVVVIEKPKFVTLQIKLLLFIGGIPGRIQISMCYIYVKSVASNVGKFI